MNLRNMSEEDIMKLSEEDIQKLNGEAYTKLHGLKVICEICKKKINITYAVQCFFCNRWICRDCGKEHFKKTITEEEFRKEKFNGWSAYQYAHWSYLNPPN